MIVLGTTLWTDSHRGRVKNLFFNRGRTPPFLVFTSFFNRTTSVGDSFMFERENTLATNCARTAYYRTFSRRGSHRGSRRGCCGVTFIFIWIVPAVTVTITSIKRWNTFSRIGTCELCWRTLNWNRGERLHAWKSYDYKPLTVYKFSILRKKVHEINGFKMFKLQFIMACVQYLLPVLRVVL